MRLAGVEDRLRHIDETVILIDERIGDDFAAPRDEDRLTSGLSDVRTEIAKLRVAIADKPSRLYMWCVMAAMAGAYTAALAAVGMLLTCPPQ
jgi:hypothetical protein